MSRPPEPTAADIETWTQLVAEAERCLAKPTLSTVTLEKVCGRAFRAVYPGGENNADNVFLRLLNAARSYARSTTWERGQMTGALGRALDAAAAVRDLVPGSRDRPPPATPPPILPFRADIDG